VQIASYRDPNCRRTIEYALRQAASPAKVFFGIVEQRCGAGAHCKGGVMPDGSVREKPADPECVKDFCSSAFGEAYCGGGGTDGRGGGQVRLIELSEREAMGPMMARYLASKLWRGENFFMQLDSHINFGPSWDDKLRAMVAATPNPPKAVISTYPIPCSMEPGSFAGAAESAGVRMCGSLFSAPGGEGRIVRLEGSSMYERLPPKTPRFTPFVAAGFYFAPAGFLRDVPFDPYLAWVFMGEEILLSARLWTYGWDFYTPTHNVVGHHYFETGAPRFWETLGRVYETPGMHNYLQGMVVERIKQLIGYPESQRLEPENLNVDLEHFGLGKVRPLADYMAMVGVDVAAKTTTTPSWCQSGKTPPLLVQKYGASANY